MILGLLSRKNFNGLFLYSHLSLFHLILKYRYQFLDLQLKLLLLYISEIVKKIFSETSQVKILTNLSLPLSLYLVEQGKVFFWESLSR